METIYHIKALMFGQSVSSTRRNVMGKYGFCILRGICKVLTVPVFVDFTEGKVSSWVGSVWMAVSWLIERVKGVDRQSFIQL